MLLNFIKLCLKQVKKVNLRIKILHTNYKKIANKKIILRSKDMQNIKRKEIIIG